MVAEQACYRQVESIFDELEIHLIADIELITFVGPLFDINALLYILIRFIIITFGMLA